MEKLYRFLDALVIFYFVFPLLFSIFIILVSLFIYRRKEVKKEVEIYNYISPKPDNTLIEVLGPLQRLPVKAIKIGRVKVGETGHVSQGGSYRDILYDAINQARAMGGNTLHITEHRYPGFYSNGHRIKADVYLLN